VGDFVDEEFMEKYSLMNRVAIFSLVTSLLACSCGLSPTDAIPTTYSSKTIEHPTELAETITPSPTATSTSRPLSPTKSINAVTSAAPTITKTQATSLSTLDCSPAIYLKKIGVSNKPQAPIDLAVYDNTAYIVDSEGLWVMDVSDPTYPIDMGFKSTHETKQVIVENGYAFGIDARGLWVFDLADPIAPQFIGSKDTPFVPLEFSINKGFAYVRDDHGILRIFDLTDPTSITEIGVYDPPGQILGREIVGNQIFVMRGLANENPLPSFSLSGEYIYLADLDGGLRVIDISDPTRPTEIGSNTLQISDVEVVGDQAYLFEVVVGQNIHLWVLSIATATTLDDPTHLGMLQNWWWNMTSNGLCSFISEIFTLLIESEVNHPEVAQINPKDFMAPLKGVDIIGDIVYVADDEEGLVIFEIIAAEK
jgi:hypothetical protein